MERNKFRWIKKIQKVKNVSYQFACLPTEIRNNILSEIKNELINNTQIILDSNQKDVKKAIATKLKQSLIDRLTLNQKRIQEMISAIDTIISLPDPVNQVISEWTRPNGLKIKKLRVPIGVIFMIYESRPNVTIDSVALCIKSGNCVILRGGSESINTNKTLIKIVKNAISNVWKKFNLEFKDDIVLFIDEPSYDIMYELLKLENYIDLVIPRGGEKMISIIKSRSVIPVLSHGSGICHTFVDATADVEKSIQVCFNAKVQRPAVCNAMETLLVHKDIAEKFLPKMAKMYIEHNVELRGCKKTIKILNQHGIKIKPAKLQDWTTEYLDLILSIKIVENIDEAIEHINKFGSHHSDAIMSTNSQNIQKFCNEVDSAAVFVNSSTRLHDGGVFGFGTEIGISTSKLHARGTMGLNELTTTKYIVVGDGTIRT